MRMWKGKRSGGIGREEGQKKGTKLKLGTGVKDAGAGTGGTEIGEKAAGAGGVWGGGVTKQGRYVVGDRERKW